MATKEFTGYRDSQGRKVYVGDKIEFLFWLPSVAGLFSDEQMNLF